MLVKANNQLDGEEFIEELIRIILYLWKIEEVDKGIDYLETMLRYVYSTNRKLTDKDMEKVAKRIEKTYPERSEAIMTLAEIYMKKGKAEGKKEGKKEGKIEGKVEIAKNLLKRGDTVKEVAGVTGLSEEEIERLQTK